MSDTPAPQTAAEAHASRRRDIARLVDVLELELDKLDPEDRPDLDFVRTTLIDLVSGLSGTERERVEAFLAEAE